MHARVKTLAWRWKQVKMGQSMLLYVEKTKALWIQWPTSGSKSNGRRSMQSRLSLYSMHQQGGWLDIVISDSSSSSIQLWIEIHDIFLNIWPLPIAWCPVHISAKANSGGGGTHRRWRGSLGPLLSWRCRGWQEQEDRGNWVFFNSEKHMYT